MIWAAVMAALLFLATGCASLTTRPSLSTVVKMSQEGVPSTEIIAQMKKNEAVYFLSDEEIENLQKQGVSYSVTNYMRDTRNQAMERETARQMYYDTWIRDPVSGNF